MTVNTVRILQLIPHRGGLRPFDVLEHLLPQRVHLSVLPISAESEASFKVIWLQLGVVFDQGLRLVSESLVNLVDIVYLISNCTLVTP